MELLPQRRSRLHTRRGGINVCWRCICVTKQHTRIYMHLYINTRKPTNPHAHTYVNNIGERVACAKMRCSIPPAMQKFSTARWKLKFPCDGKSPAPQRYLLAGIIPQWQSILLLSFKFCLWSLCFQALKQLFSRHYRRLLISLMHHCQSISSTHTVKRLNF